MDIKEIQEKKIQLTLEITKLLGQFSKETSLTVKNISIDQINVAGEGNPYYIITIQVEI